MLVVLPAKGMKGMGLIFINSCQNDLRVFVCTHLPSTDPEKLCIINKTEPMLNCHVS